MSTKQITIFKNRLSSTDEIVKWCNEEFGPRKSNDPIAFWDFSLDKNSVTFYFQDDVLFHLFVDKYGK